MYVFGAPFCVLMGILRFSCFPHSTVVILFGIFSCGLGRFSGKIRTVGTFEFLVSKRQSFGGGIL